MNKKILNLAKGQMFGQRPDVWPSAKSKINTLESAIFSTIRVTTKTGDWAFLSEDPYIREKLQNLESIIFNGCFSQKFLTHLANLAQSDGEIWDFECKKGDRGFLFQYLNHTWKRVWEQDKVYAFCDGGNYPKYLLFNTGLQTPNTYDDIFICLFRRPEKESQYAVKKNTIMLQNHATGARYKYWRAEGLKDISCRVTPTHESGDARDMCFALYNFPKRALYFDQ
jgi:hypothetical protein